MSKKSAFAEVAIFGGIALLALLGWFVVRPIVSAEHKAKAAVATVKSDVSVVKKSFTPAPVADEGNVYQPAQEGIWVSIKDILTLIGVGSLIAGVALALGIFFGVFKAPYPTAAMLATLGAVILGGLSILTFLGWIAVIGTLALIGFSVWHWYHHHTTVVNSSIAHIETDALKLWKEICFLFGKLKAAVKALFAKKPPVVSAGAQTPPTSPTV